MACCLLRSILQQANLAQLISTKVIFNIISKKLFQNQKFLVY